MKCVKATYSQFKSNVGVTRKNRKTTAIYGGSPIPLQRRNLLEYIIPSSLRRKRSASKVSEERARKDGDAGDSRDGEEGASKDSDTSTLTSFDRVLKRGAIHTAECCRLGVPRAFCERYKVESHLTMTDSTGHRLWHMRFQSCGVLNLSRPSVYTISNGWREFSYDHSLKVNDRVVFTLLSTSHFLVEFATSNGSKCAMLPTRGGEDYPWKINYARLDCLSNANDVDSSQVWLQDMQESVIQKNAAPITLEDEQEELLPLSGSRRESPMTLPKKQQLQKEMFCQCDTAKVGKGIGTRNNTRWKEYYVLPELTHLECKNPDGSSYLQIVDSDSEIT